MTKVMTVMKTKKMFHTTKKKGELMENDQDAMEVLLKSLSSLFDTHTHTHKQTFEQVCLLSCVVVFIRRRRGGSADGPHRLSDQTEESFGAC